MPYVPRAIPFATYPLRSIAKGNALALPLIYASPIIDTIVSNTLLTTAGNRLSRIVVTCSTL